MYLSDGVLPVHWCCLPMRLEISFPRTGHLLKWEERNFNSMSDAACLSGGGQCGRRPVTPYFPDHCTCNVMVPPPEQVDR